MDNRLAHHRPEPSHSVGEPFGHMATVQGRSALPLFESCCVSELGSARNTLDDDARNLVRNGGVVAGHAVHGRHPGHHSCGDPLLDGVLGESIVNHRTFPIAMATPLDLLKLNGAVAHVVNDEGARLIPARQFAPMERDRLSNREYHGIAFAGLKGNAGGFVELCRSLPVDLANAPPATA